MLLHEDIWLCHNRIRHGANFSRATDFIQFVPKVSKNHSIKLILIEGLIILTIEYIDLLTSPPNMDPPYEKLGQFQIGINMAT